MMPIIGAYMGGNTSPIAAGYGLFKGQWLTSDGLNIDSAIINLSGPENISLNVDQNGYVSKVLKAGTYNATVTHGGEYSGDEPKTFVVPNRDEIIVTWFASRKYKVSVVVSSPFSSQSVAYTVKNDSDEVIYSGSSWSSSMTFQLYSGSYTLSITYAGDTMTYAFDVGNSDKSIDITDRFCKISIIQPIPSLVLSITYNGVSMGMVNEFYVIKADSSRTISYSGIPSYNGLSSSAVATVSSSNIVPSSDSISLSPTAVGTVLTLSSAGTLKVPLSGKYHVLVIGGGGGGGNSYGGGSGEVADDTLQLTASESYAIEIGSGGTGGNNSTPGAGGATSFGTLLSASGGSEGTGGSGGGGSAGGGGGTGNAYGGGGGAGKNTNSGSSSGGTGVTANGGSGGSRDVSPTVGGAGISETNSFYAGDATGGGRAGSRGGGGGGGGRGATGGKGGSGSSSYAWACGGGGGGGGVAGGNGGAGGAGSTSSSKFNPGMGGIGLGAGGGGAPGRVSGSSGTTGGGGGGGGLGTGTYASNGGTSRFVGGKGGKGGVRIQWVS